MKNIILLSVYLLTNFTIYAQRIENNPEFKNKKIVIDTAKTISKIVELDRVINGFGPAGNASFSIASRDLISKEELKAYPQMKNLPDSLTNVKEYLFILDDFQFNYQNYKQGIYSKDLFIKKAKGNGRKLADTIYLTDKKIKNTISIVSGKTSDNRIVYIVDTNNNNDYSDDELKPLLMDIRKQDDIIKNSQFVDIEYFDGQEIKKGKQLISVGKQTRSNELSFKFPQFRYGKVKLGDATYIIVSESVSFDKSIYLVKDQPYFDRLDRKYSVEPYQYLNVDDYYIQYSKISQNNDKVKLTISSNDSENKITPVANQVEMLAPNLSGINIRNNQKISLNQYKGKYVFLDFWSTSCPPCIKEFPYIKKVYDKFDNNEIAIIGIADIRGRIDIKEFALKYNITWPTIDEKDSSTRSEGYIINSWPTTYLIDPMGKIIETNLRGKDLNNKLELLGLTKKD